MRLLQVSLRKLLTYSLIVVVVSIPISFYSIRTILNGEVDETLQLYTEQFIEHVKSYELLEDLERDLIVLDELSYNIDIKPIPSAERESTYYTFSVYDSLNKELKPFRQLASPIIIKGKPYLLTIQISLVESDELAYAIVSVQALLIIILAIGLLVINRNSSKKLWKPFYKTLDQLKAYQLDKSESIQNDPTKIVEFDDLNKTIQHLTDRNRNVYLQQKEFTENASHELQTPLAIFQTKLYQLMQNGSLSETDANTLQELEETAQRMSRLVKNLLLLSKIENEQFTDTEVIDLSKMINHLLSYLQSMAEVDNIIIEHQIKSFELTANKTLIEVLINNLLHNAVRHTSKGGKILVHLDNGKLSIENSGQPLKMESHKIFERFSKEGGNESNTGLGLALVKKICETCSFQLNYHYTSGVHVFTVTF